MNLGALALEAYQLNRPCSMGFPFCFFPGYLRLLFNIHGYIPFSKGKMLNTFQKNGCGGIDPDTLVESLNIFNPDSIFKP